MLPMKVWLTFLYKRFWFAGRMLTGVFLQNLSCAIVRLDFHLKHHEER